MNIYSTYACECREWNTQCFMKATCPLDIRDCTCGDFHLIAVGIGSMGYPLLAIWVMLFGVPGKHLDEHGCKDWKYIDILK